MNVNDLVERLRAEAEISDRPGQMDRLNALADEFAAALEAAREDAARLTAAQQRPVEGEEIMVNAAHDVYTLPLQPSGLSSGPRFVVHVPGPEQPAPQAQSSTEAWRDFAIAGAAIVEEIREIVGLKGKPGDVVEAVRELADLADSRGAAGSVLQGRRR